MFRDPPPRPTEARRHSERLTLIRGLLEAVRGLPELESHRRWAKLFPIPRQVGSDLLGNREDHRTHEKAPERYAHLLAGRRSSENAVGRQSQTVGEIFQLHLRGSPQT